MKVPSEEIPQADNIVDVINTVISVANGRTTFQGIANAIGKVERQGRYYRKAAEILGLIRTSAANHSVLTGLGEQLIKTGATIHNPIIPNSVFSAKIFQKVIPYLELNQKQGVSRNQIIEFLLINSDLSEESMAPRRVSSVISWLENLHLLYKNNDKYYLSTKEINQKVNLIEFTNSGEPILPGTSNLHDYETVKLRVDRLYEEVISYRNLAKLDRADNAHRTLVNLVAQKIKESGSIPRCNQLIDLATRHKEQDYIFEMKSTTIDNCKSQIRSGLSQLYEYRYLQNLPNAHLILVVENPLAEKDMWIAEYLESDRNIFFIWDGNNDLFSSQNTKEKLSFLKIQ